MPRKRGDNARLQLAACNVGFKSPVLGGGHCKSGCRPLSESSFGEEGTARTELGDGGRGVSREHHRGTADKDPASHLPGDVSTGEPAAPFALTTQAGEQNQPKEEKTKETKEKEGPWKRQRLSNAQTFSNRQTMENALLAPTFLPAGHPHLVFISLNLR